MIQITLASVCRVCDGSHQSTNGSLQVVPLHISIRGRYEEENCDGNSTGGYAGAAAGYAQQVCL
jgi:hypothetical protein